MTGGFGRMLRKEDPRFVRGQGYFVDDVQLPGMLYGAVLRSPHPHARILAIDTLAAEAHPRVRAVITGETLAERNLAWMPTLFGDRQAVLATDKVRFQGQEVAFVVAEDRYSAPGRPGADRRRVRAAAPGYRRPPRSGPQRPAHSR